MNEVFVRFLRKDGTYGTATFDSAQDAHTFILGGVTSGYLICLSERTGPGAADYDHVAAAAFKDAMSRAGRVQATRTPGE